MTQKQLWTNALGEPVDLDDIDREYALNILTMALLRRGDWGCTSAEVREDELIQKLREVILTGRTPTARDRMRGRRYNALCRLRGLSFRAPVR